MLPSRPRRSAFGAALGAALALAACGGDTASSGQAPPPASTPTAAATAGSAGGCQNPIRTCMQERTTPPPTVIDPAKTYTATIHTPRGDIVAALDQKVAPATVNNFVYLSQNRFYDGLTFHRVEPGFVIQGGDPLGNGTGGPGYKLPNETNPTPFVKGTLAMASNAAGVSGSQFFILLGDAQYLSRSGVYNPFGHVLSGQDVAAQVRVGDVIKIDVSDQ